MKTVRPFLQPHRRSTVTNNAVYNAVGVRIDEVPIMPEKVLKTLRDKTKGGDGRFGPDSIPSVEWPEPLRVLTPAEGGDGREMPRVAVHS